jgi:hypothetical protein
MLNSVLQSETDGRYVKLQRMHLESSALDTQAIAVLGFGQV